MLLTCWDILSHATKLHIEATYQQGGQTDELLGAVQVTEQDDTQLLLVETGLWQRQKLKAHNHTLWQRTPMGIRLSHQRREQPVLLCHFTEANNWCDTHICGDDHYQDRLSHTKSQVIVTWQIEGKNKKGRLVQRYFA